MLVFSIGDQIKMKLLGIAGEEQAATFYFIMLNKTRMLSEAQSLFQTQRRVVAHVLQQLLPALEFTVNNYAVYSSLLFS